MAQSWICSPQTSCTQPVRDWLFLQWWWNPPQWTILIPQGADDIFKAVTQHAQSGRCMFWHLHACVACSSAFSSFKHKQFLEVCCRFFLIPMSSSHLRGNARTSIYLLYSNKAMESQTHFMPVSHFLLPCHCVSSLQPIHLFCLWPFGRFPWYLCSLKSSAVCSVTYSIVNTSKTVQTAG